MLTKIWDGIFAPSPRFTFAAKSPQYDFRDTNEHRDWLIPHNWIVGILRICEANFRQPRFATEPKSATLLLDLSNGRRDTFNGIWNAQRTKVAPWQTELLESARSLKNQLKAWRR
jgi:hypothetical protein